MATQADVAKHIDLSSRRVRALIQSGVLPAQKGRGGLDVDTCRWAYINYLRGLGTGQVKTTNGDLDMNEERARLTHHQANLAELDERVKRGDLVEFETVVDEVAEAIGNCRAKLLNLPPKVSTLLAGMSDVFEIQSTLEFVVYEALEELHNDYAGEPEG